MSIFETVFLDPDPHGALLDMRARARRRQLDCNPPIDLGDASMRGVWITSSLNLDGTIDTEVKP